MLNLQNLLQPLHCFYSSLLRIFCWYHCCLTGLLILSDLVHKLQELPGIVLLFSSRHPAAGIKQQY